VCAARAEVHNGPLPPVLPGRFNDACRLRGDECLVVDHAEQEGLDDLRLDQGGFDPQERLPGEDRRPLRHGHQRAAEAELGQVFEELVRYAREDREAAQVVDLGAGEGEFLQVGDGLLQPGTDQVRALGG